MSLKAPWLRWLGGTGWRCDRCEAVGTFPVGAPVDSTVRLLEEILDAHRDCHRATKPRGGGEANESGS